MVGVGGKDKPAHLSRWSRGAFQGQAHTVKRVCRGNGVAVEFIGECGNSRKGHTQGRQRGTPFRVNGAGRAQEQNVGSPARSLEGRHEPGVLPFLFCVLVSK